MEKAKKKPGKLLRSGLTEMGRYLQGRLGEAGELEGSWRDQKVKAYLAQILFTQHSPQAVGVRNVLPMGWTAAVTVVQHIHRSI